MCGECAGCLWARERYAMSALRCFITSKAKLKKNVNCVMCMYRRVPNLR